MGLTLHFYIIFGTNLLTGGPARIAFFAYFQRFEGQEYQTESKRNETFGSDLFGRNVIQGTWSGRQATEEAATRVHRPTSSSYIYPETIEGHHEKLFPPPQPSVSARSHLGAFAGAPPEGESTMEGLYIISKALPMSCEQFTADLRVHSYQLDGFFSIFESQYKVLLDLLGDLFNVTLFVVCLSRSDELWVYDQVYL